jgi:cyanophycin synthetase
MADHCPGAITYFAADRYNPIIATHRAQGKRVVYRDGEAIVAAEGLLEHRIALANIPITHNGMIGFQVDNAMAAIAAAWALGLSWQTIRAGLSSFINDAQTAPGRFNLFDYRGATLIADYGHNPDAIKALVEAIAPMPARRRVAVISGAGDRRDEDIRQQTEILGEVFDDLVLYQDSCQRGRADGEIIALLRDGLKNATRTKTIDEIHGEFIAIDTALAKLRPGDLCLILIDQIEEALAHIAAHCAGQGSGRRA